MPGCVYTHCSFKLFVISILWIYRLYQQSDIKQSNVITWKDFQIWGILPTHNGIAQSAQQLIYIETPQFYATWQDEKNIMDMDHNQYCLPKYIYVCNAWFCTHVCSVDSCYPSLHSSCARIWVLSGRASIHWVVRCLPNRSREVLKTQDWGQTWSIALIFDIRSGITGADTPVKI